MAGSAGACPPHIAHGKPTIKVGATSLFIKNFTFASRNVKIPWYFMRCPKCGYTSFEFETCPKCETDFLVPGGRTDNYMYEKGGFWIRFVAFIVDNIIICITVALLSYVAGIAAEMGGITRNARPEEVEHLATLFGLFIGLFFGPVYFTLFTGWDGQTIGKWIFGLRVVRTSGDPIGYWKALLRYTGYSVSLLLFGLGFFMIAVDRNKRGLHDLIAGTYVIREHD